MTITTTTPTASATTRSSPSSLISLYGSLIKVCTSLTNIKEDLLTLQGTIDHKLRLPPTCPYHGPQHSVYDSTQLVLDECTVPPAGLGAFEAILWLITYRYAHNTLVVIMRQPDDVDEEARGVERVYTMLEEEGGFLDVNAVLVDGVANLMMDVNELRDEAWRDIVKDIVGDARIV